MYLKGEIDWDTGVPTDIIDEVKLRPDYQSNPQLATYYYCFNNQRKPYDNPWFGKPWLLLSTKKPS
jgi:oligopeptide transport system substrate-binding protein